MDPEEWWTADHRDEVAEAIETMGSYDHVLVRFMNGNQWPLHVQVQNGLISIPEIRLKDGHLERQYIEQCIYALACLLTPAQIHNLLNANRDQILETSYVGLMPNDDDRGYTPFLFYRGGSGDQWHVIPPNEDGIFPVKIGLLVSIDPEATAELLLDYDYMFP